MSVGADTAHEEVDATVGLDFLFIACTPGIQVGSVAVQDIGVLRLDVYMAEEVVPHKGIVAFGMFLGQTYILVHIESHYVLKRHDAFLVQVDKFLVHAQRRRTGGASQYKRFFRCRISGLDLGSHIMCSPL